MKSPLRVVAVAIGHDLPATIAYVWRTHGRADLVPEAGPVVFVDVHELVGLVVVAVDGDRMTHFASARKALAGGVGGRAAAAASRGTPFLSRPSRSESTFTAAPKARTQSTPSAMVCLFT